MKLFAIVMCALLVGANAGILDDLKTQLSGLGDAFKATAGHVADNGKVILNGLLEQLKQAGGQLLMSSAQKLLEQLGTQAPGKRDLSMLEKLEGSMHFLNEHFETAKEQVHDIVEASMEKLHQAAEKIMTMDFLQQPKEKIMAEIDNAIAHHKEVTSGFMKNVIHDLLMKMRPAPNKRFLKDTFQGLVNFLQPHIQSVTDGVKAIGDQLKGHATNLHQAVKDSAEQLKNKLSGHVDQLKTHAQSILGQGKDGVNALKAAVTDILKQSLSNIKDTAVNGLQGTINSAANTVTQHIVDSLKKANEKRFLRDTFEKFMNFLTPQVQAVAESLKKASENIKNQAGDLHQAVKDSAKQLTTKLSAHVDQLKEQGKTILSQGRKGANALREAVTKVLKESLGNIKTTATNGIQGTIKDAANTVTNHILEALKKADKQ